MTKNYKLNLNIEINLKLKQAECLDNHIPLFTFVLILKLCKVNKHMMIDDDL